MLLVRVLGLLTVPSKKRTDRRQPSRPRVPVHRTSFHPLHWRHRPRRHLHRIGRTGRAGEEGIALSVVEVPRELSRLERIEDLLDEPIERGQNLESNDDLSFLRPTHRTLLIFAGRADKLRKSDVLGGLVKDAGIPAEMIGRIDLMPKACGVAIATEYASQAMEHLRTGRIKNKRLRGRLL